MKQFYFFAFAVLLSSNILSAQEEDNDKKPSTFTLQFNQDNAAGFYPAIYGSWGLNAKTSFTFYTTFWTNTSFGSHLTGTDLWLETGAGLLFFADEDRWLINPTLGFTHGKLLSGGGQSVVGDGIVPALTSFYTGKVFDGELYITYYKSLRSVGPVTSDYFQYWIYPGIWLSEKIAIGVHQEGYFLARQTGAESEVLYEWLGGFIKFNIDDKYIFRFSAGKNFVEDGDFSPEFYKMTVNLNF